MARQELKHLVSNTYRNRGDALAGERVIAQARTVGRPRVVPGTAKHRIQEIVLKSNVLCVIDRPLRLKDEAMKIKNSDA